MPSTAVQIEPSDRTLGATVTGRRIADYSMSDIDVVKSAFLEYAVLIWPGQHLTEEEQMTFAACFGDLVIEYTSFSNVKEDGALRPAKDPVMRLFKGNEGWHTDSSFQMLAAKASMLTAVEVPKDGGQTEWADMRAAYDELDSVTRTRIHKLCAYHSLYRSQGKIGDGEEVTAAALANLHARDRKKPGNDLHKGYGQQGEDPLRSLVKKHPETGRHALYIGRHAYAIPGMTESEAQQLLDELLTSACQTAHVLTHEWEVGDLVMWDNRCVLHRARPWPLDQARVMQHTRVDGELESESALNSPMVVVSNQ